MLPGVVDVRVVFPVAAFASLSITLAPPVTAEAAPPFLALSSPYFRSPLTCILMCQRAGDISLFSTHRRNACHQHLHATTFQTWVAIAQFPPSALLGTPYGLPSPLLLPCPWCPPCPDNLPIWSSGNACMWPRRLTSPVNHETTDTRNFKAIEAPTMSLSVIAASSSIMVM